MSKAHALHIKKVVDGLLDEWLCVADNCQLSEQLSPTTFDSTYHPERRVYTLTLLWRIHSITIPAWLLEELFISTLMHYTSAAVDFSVQLQGNNLYVGPFTLGRLR